jgi:hypothetical protein
MLVFRRKGGSEGATRPIVLYVLASLTRDRSPLGRSPTETLVAYSSTTVPIAIAWGKLGLKSVHGKGGRVGQRELLVLACRSERVVP